jgi:HNH endonuclease
MAPVNSTPRLCSIEGCTAPSVTRGWCPAHRARWRRHGDPRLGKPAHIKGTVEYRLKARSSLQPNGCILWNGAKTAAGYGTLNVQNTRQLVHRLAYELYVGPIPEGLTLDHLCRTRACINPEHLEAVTNRENILRGTSPSAKQARRTHCPSGHPYAGENLIRWRNHRHCRACMKQWATKRRKLGKLL